MKDISSNTNNITQTYDEIIITSITNPHQLLSKVRSFTSQNQYEDALDLLDKAIITKLGKVNHNKEDKSLIPLYLEYAQVLITKQFNSQDLFGDIKKEEDTENIHNDNNIAENNEIPEEDNENSIHNDESNESDDEQEEEYNDQELAYDYLFTCQKILKSELNNPSENECQVKEESNQLSEVYLLFAQLELLKSDNKKAISFFEKGLEIRKRNDEKFSRAIADIYYQMSIAYDFDIFKCFTCLYKVKIIMEYHLQKLIDRHYFLSKPVFYNKEEEDLLEKEKIEDYKSIKVNSDDVEIKETDSDDISEIKSILIEVYLKIDDTIEGIESQKEYLIAVQKEKERKEKEENKENGVFNSKYDDSKLINANCLLKKKREKAETSVVDKKNDDEKRNEDKDLCLKLIEN